MLAHFLEPLLLIALALVLIVVGPNQLDGLVRWAGRAMHRLLRRVEDCISDSERSAHQ